MTKYNKATRMFEAYVNKMNCGRTVRDYENFKTYITDYKKFEEIERLAGY